MKNNAVDDACRSHGSDDKCFKNLVENPEVKNGFHNFVNNYRFKSISNLNYIS